MYGIHYSKHDHKFWKSRDVHIDRYVTEVVGELSGGANDQIDECADKLPNVETEKICMECGGENDRSYNVCRSCPGHLTLPPAVEFSAFESNGTLCDPYVAFNAIDV